MQASGGPTEAAVELVFREAYGRILATLIRIFGDFDLAEDALQEAFVSAVEHWPAEGIPTNPAGWLSIAARRKAVDRLRREQTMTHTREQLEHADHRLPPGIEEDVDGRPRESGLKQAERHADQCQQLGGAQKRPRLVHNVVLQFAQSREEHADQVLCEDLHRLRGQVEGEEVNAHRLGIVHDAQDDAVAVPGDGVAEVGQE